MAWLRVTQSVIGMAVFTIVPRFSLAKYQEKGPRLLMTLYGLNAALPLICPLLVSAVTGLAVGELMDTSTISGVATYVAIIFINRAYDNNRAHLFVN